MWRPSPSRTSSRALCGPSGPTNARSRLTPAPPRTYGCDDSPGNCTECPHHGAPVGPARGHADNSVGQARSCKRLAPRARMSMMARSRNGSTDEAEDTTAVRLVVQRLGSSRIATVLRARQGPSAASGGALRAALTRAHAVASVQLCDEGTPSSLVASVGGTERTSYSVLLSSWRRSPDTVLGR